MDQLTPADRRAAIRVQMADLRQQLDDLDTEEREARTLGWPGYANDLPIDTTGERPTIDASWTDSERRMAWGDR